MEEGTEDGGAYCGRHDCEVREDVVVRLCADKVFIQGAFPANGDGVGGKIVILNWHPQGLRVSYSKRH